MRCTTGTGQSSVDLKYAYFHIPIHVRSRCLLRFAPSFPIQGPTVRFDVCPTDIYQGNSSVGTPCSPACSLPSPVSRRLAIVPVRHDLLDHHLRWWLDRTCTRAGMLLDVPEAQVRLFTDASQSGWRAHLDKVQVTERWSTREATLHINHLEMLAVLYALRAFRVQLTGLAVQLMSDNASVVSYIRKQGGNPMKWSAEYNKNKLL